jgi:hypothetical protein
MNVPVFSSAKKSGMHLLRCSLISVMMAVGVGTPSAAQRTPPYVITQRQIVERTSNYTYVTAGEGFGKMDELIFEGTIAPWFYGYSGTAPVDILAAPQVILRMYDEDSRPVTAPSYMPRLRLNFFDRKRRGLYSVIVSHHSNGQNGPFYKPDGSINYDNGNFSTNFVNLSYYHHRLRSVGMGEAKAGADVDDSVDGGFTAGNVFGISAIEWFRVGMEVPLVPGHAINREPDLEGLFSFYRVNAAIQTAELPTGLERRAIGRKLPFGTYQTRLEIFWRSPHELDEKPTSALDQVDVSLTGLLGYSTRDDVNLYLNYYYGADYYNIRFQDRLHVFRFGVRARIGNFRLEKSDPLRGL